MQIFDDGLCSGSLRLILARFLGRMLVLRKVHCGLILGFSGIQDSILHTFGIAEDLDFVFLHFWLIYCCIASFSHHTLLQMVQISIDLFLLFSQLWDQIILFNHLNSIDIIQISNTTSSLPSNLFLFLWHPGFQSFNLICSHRQQSFLFIRIIEDLSALL